MKNSDYWKQRFEQLENAQNQQGVDALQQIERQYKQAQKEIEGKINTWYQRFAKNNGVSMAEARKMLSGVDLKEFKWDVQEYIKYGQDNALMGGWMKELENASAKYHISKLEALKIQTQQSLESLFSKQLGTVTSTLGDVLQSGYYHTAYELQKGFGIGWDIGGLDQSQIEKLLSKPWAADGYNFSERIWKNKDKLIQEVHTELTHNIMLGSDPQKAIDAIAKKMNTSKNNAGRLVMTEEAYFSSVAQGECFNDLDVEEYEVVATLDSHTSDICRSLDGQVFPMKDYQAGVTAPPFHVYCRSTTVPHFSEDFGQIGERAARDAETGKTYYIPDDMKYQEWEDTFVKGGDKSGFTVFDDGSALHYTHTPVVEPPKPKKEYLTKKKLQANIANADVQLEDLENQFKAVSGGWGYDEVIKDFGSLEDFADGDELSKMKALHSQMEALEQQKAEWQEKLNEKLKAEQKKALIKQQLELEKQAAAVQQQLDGMEIKTYSGIWKDDVTTADFAKLNIEGKKKYYEGKFITETDPDLMQKYQNLYKQLQELEVEGKAYDDVQKELQKIQAELNKVQADLQKLEKGDIIDTVDDAFSQARKDAALWAKSTKEADDALRDVCGDVWKNAPKAEKDAIYGYTSSYSKINEPLRGIEYGTNTFKGVGNIDFDTIGTNYGGHKRGQVRKQINAMTDIIEKSTYDFDIWLQRGCDYRGMDNFFEISMSDLQNATQAELERLLLGKTVTDYGFFSCGVSKGKGFSHKPIIMNVYAPKGTKMMYAEPFSAFGNGSGRSWDGVSKQSSFGNESEIILQQGTAFRVTKVERTNGKLYVDIEVIMQNNPQR